MTANASDDGTAGGSTATADDPVLEYMTRLSNWGRWGEDDDKGTLNLISPTAMRRGLDTVTEGLSVSCSRPISTRLSREQGVPLLHHMLSSGTDAPDEGMHSAYDWIGMGIHGHAFTHLDSHSHVFWNGMQYNNRPASTVETRRGATKGSIESAAAGMVGRGVLLDIPRLLGRDSLEPGEAILPSVLEECEAHQGCKVEPGDILLIRTGRDAARYDSAEPAQHGGSAGLHASNLPWLHERDVAVLGSDAANDVVPSASSIMRVPIHIVGIVAMGLWLLDNAYLEALADEALRLKRWTFLISLAPLRLHNATGSPVNPIAIF